VEPVIARIDDINEHLYQPYYRDFINKIERHVD